MIKENDKFFFVREKKACSAEWSKWSLLSSLAFVAGLYECYQKPTLRLHQSNTPNYFTLDLMYQNIIKSKHVWLGPQKTEIKGCNVKGLKCSDERCVMSRVLLQSAFCSHSIRKHLLCLMSAFVIKWVHRGAKFKSILFNSVEFCEQKNSRKVNGRWKMMEKQSRGQQDGSHQCCWHCPWSHG